MPKPPVLQKVKYYIENISLHAMSWLHYCGFIKTAQQRVVLFCHKVQGLRLMFGK